MASAGTGLGWLRGRIADANMVGDIVESPPKPGEYGDYWDDHDRVGPGGMGVDGGGYLKGYMLSYYLEDQPGEDIGSISDRIALMTLSPDFSPPHNIGNITDQPGFEESPPASGPLAYRSPWFCPYHYKSGQNCLIQKSERFEGG
jgi:hypothetical protein